MIGITVLDHSMKGAVAPFEYDANLASLPDRFVRVVVGFVEQLDVGPQFGADPFF